MKIFMVHNCYQQYGGEDAVVKAEYDLLKQKGEQVFRYERHNHEIHQYHFPKKIKCLWDMPWSRETYLDMKARLASVKPDVAHVYNTYFMITPSVYYACKDQGIPIVQSLYNYRLVCANALFLRNQKLCTQCLTQPRWKSIVYRCYNHSAIQTALVVRLINSHWRRQTWTHLIDGYITATEFSRQKHIEAGIHPQKITVKPHFLSFVPNMEEKTADYAFFVGRISEEKGVEVLLQAWRSVKNLELRIMGTGPLLEKVRTQVAQEGLAHISVLGFRPDEEFKENLKRAKFLIVPSICFDNFPRTIVEAYAYGIPVVASDLDGIKEHVKEGVTGYTFRAGDAEDLAKTVHRLLQEAGQLQAMRQNARREFEEKYSPHAQYPLLKQVYEKAIKNFKENAASYAV